jgi:hypothetical protein
MAKFCTSCGNPMAEGARFCAVCGAGIPGQAAAAAAPPPVHQTPVGSAPVAPAPAAPVSAPPAAPAPGTGSGIKILFIVLGVIVFLFLLVAGSCFYVAYRVKQKASEFKAELGVNAPPYRGSKDACSKLSVGEASAALGQPVTSAEQRSSILCIYHYGPNGANEIPIHYTWQGGAMAFKFAHGAMKQAGAETFTELPGIGDEAYLDPMASLLLMRKGDVEVHIDMRAGELNADAAKAMATKIADRL